MRTFAQRFIAFVLLIAATTWVDWVEKTRSYSRPAADSTTVGDQRTFHLPGVVAKDPAAHAAIRRAQARSLAYVSEQKPAASVDLGGQNLTLLLAPKGAPSAALQRALPRILRAQGYSEHAIQSELSQNQESVRIGVESDEVWVDAHHVATNCPDLDGTSGKLIVHFTSNGRVTQIVSTDPALQKVAAKAYDCTFYVKPASQIQGDATYRNDLLSASRLVSAF